LIAHLPGGGEEGSGEMLQTHGKVQGK